ncbi:MAG TPA: glycoside hydrolase family 44 protein [Candidatus Limnocylindrales bacterium]|nr:glycoside hydrolase family 44 protein [Candidatus Limnocylindrales bacterium]
MHFRSRSRIAGLLLAVAVLAPSAAGAQNAAVTVQVNPASGRHPIDPRVYGVAHATAAQLTELNCPLNRSGGNNTSRYNWQLNADNRGADWYFESLAYSSATPGEVGDTFIAASRSAAAEPMLTIPIIEYVATLGASRARRSSFSIAKYGAQQDSDWQWFPDAGNGVRTDGTNVTGNDPLDANTPNSTTLEQGWVQHLVSTWGSAQASGLRYYILDNEPSIWHSTHRDVHPAGESMDALRSKTVAYATMIKNNDAAAKIVGPEEWGWGGYFYSGLDQLYGATHNWQQPYPDRSSHGNMDYLPWYLDQMRQAQAAAGKRLLDVFSVHYYPQSGEFGTDTSTTMQLRRNRSTRSLWDPSYTDESWIADKVMLIPRIKNWVAAYYPGTETAITEYNWGAEGHMNGATAQADILGIFGREGLDAAARWTTPAATTPAFKAIKMYRNYDGSRGSFGDTSVAATSSANADNLSVFAAERASDGALTVMVVSKYLSGSTPVTISLANFTAQPTAQYWRLAAGSISGPASVSLTSGALSTSVPAQSVTLFVLAKSGTANAAPAAVASATPTSGTAPLTVALSGAASSDSDGTIASYAWTFGDGQTGSGATPSHTYTAAGSYTATLTVTDNLGATGSAGVAITVSPDPSVLAAPSGLTASVAGSVVTLKWKDNSTNESGFYVERAASTRDPYTRVATTAAGAQTFSQSAPKGGYVYRVQAFSTATGKVSAYSNTASIRVK